MNWDSWSDFIRMGGYGLYVWGSYGVAAAVVALEVVLMRQRRRGALTGARQQALLNGGVHEA